MGTHAVSLTAGGPQFRSGCSGFSFSGVQMLSRARASSTGIGLTSSTILVEGLLQAEVGRAGARAGRSARAAGSPSRDPPRQPRPARARAPSPRRPRPRSRAGPRPPRARARGRSRACASPRSVSRSWSAVWPVTRRYVSASRPRRSSERSIAFEELGGARLDERVGDVDLRRLDELVDRAGAEVGLELGLDRLAQPRLDLGAQLLERLELARRPRKLVVERRQDRLLDLLQRRLGLLSSGPRERCSAIFFVSPGLIPRRPRSISSTSRPAPSWTT